MGALTLKQLTLFTLLILFSIPQANASFVDDIKASLRPALTKFFSAELANKLLGKDPNQIEMPEIPKIESNNKSVQGLYIKPKVEAKFKAEQMERFNYIFLQEIIKAVREVEAGPEEISRWMNVLSQSGSREGVYSALVLDNTYMGLQNLDRLISDSALTFTIEYLLNYVNKSIKKENLAKVNFFVVKREIAERTLQVVDELFKKPTDDVYDWYALFSSEMAQRFPKIMDNDVRKVTDARAHKAWAQSVPDQFVKSEILIKLHRVYNYLQVNAQ